jgi:hypothetical protein
MGTRWACLLKLRTPFTVHRSPMGMKKFPFFVGGLVAFSVCGKEKRKFAVFSFLPFTA